MGYLVTDSQDSFKNAASFINKSTLCLNRDAQRIFFDEIEQNQAILLNSYNVHHFILTCLLNEALYAAQRISYLHPIYSLFVITSGFVS